MKVRTVNEAWHPNKNNLELIQSVIGRIQLENFVPDAWFIKYCNSHKYRLAYDLDHVDRLTLAQKPKILEVGAMPFILTIALQNKGLSVIGVDIQPERMKAVIENNNLNIIKCDIENEALPFDKNTFDIVVLNEVFEHLRINPIHTIGEIYRVIKPNGILLLSTPNLLSLKGWLSMIFKNKTQSSVYYEYLKLSTLGHMGHVREYTPVEVCEFLTALGFSVEQIIYRGLPVSKSILKQTVTRLFLTVFPQLRRYFTVVARKADSTLSIQEGQPLPS